MESNYPELYPHMPQDRSNMQERDQVPVPMYLRRGALSLTCIERQCPPDDQEHIGLQTNLLTEEETLFIKQEKTAKEDPPVVNQPFFKYASKAHKRRAKLERKKAKAAQGKGNTEARDSKPGSSNQGTNRKRQSNDEGSLQGPPAKRPNQGRTAGHGGIEGPRTVAKANRSLAVAVCREDGVSVDEALAKLIRKKHTVNRGGGPTNDARRV